MTNLTTDVSESIQCIVCNLPQVFDSFRLALHNIEGCVYSGCRRWCDAGAEDVRSRVVAEVVCSHRVCRDEASKSGKRFAESAHNQIDVFCHTEVVACATSLIAKHADAMCLVDINGGIVFLCKFTNLRRSLPRRLP